MVMGSSDISVATCKRMLETTASSVRKNKSAITIVKANLDEMEVMTKDKKIGVESQRVH